MLFLIWVLCCEIVFSSYKKVFKIQLWPFISTASNYQIDHKILHELSSERFLCHWSIWETRICETLCPYGNKVQKSYFSTKITFKNTRSLTMTLVSFQGQDQRPKSQWTDIKEINLGKQCMGCRLTDLTHIAHNERTIPIYYQGQGSKVKVTIDRYETRGPNWRNIGHRSTISKCAMCFFSLLQSEEVSQSKGELHNPFFPLGRSV